MLEKGKRHLLFSGNRHLGDLAFDGIAYPSNHITAIFTPTEAFEEVREIFEASGTSTELITGDDRIALRHAMERSERARQQMNRLDLRIVDSDGVQEPIDDFVLDGNQAIFRYGSFRRMRG